MKVYHMSDMLPLNAEMTADYKQTSELIQPFVQALERGEDCFFGTLMAAKHQKAVLRKFGLQDMWTNYIKWATEAIFEFIRKQEFPESCSRITGHYFFNHLESCRELFEVDWGDASEEERTKIHLYEVELETDHPQALDMRMFDEAFDAMWENEDVHTAIACARRYFRGEATQSPVWEILSDARAVAVADLTEKLQHRRVTR